MQVSQSNGQLPTSAATSKSDPNSGEIHLKLAISVDLVFSSGEYLRANFF